MNKESENKSYFSEEEKWLMIISNKYYDLSVTEIAKNFHFNQGSVSKILEQYNQIGEVANQFQNCGRKQIEESIPDIYDIIINELKQDSTLTTKQISFNLFQNQKIDISHETICKILKRYGCNYAKVLIIHKLTSKNKDQRLEYPQKYLKTPKLLDEYVYSDESISSIDKFNKLTWINGDELTGIYEKQENQYKNSYCHVWGGISKLGKTQLYIHPKRVNSEAYMLCLQKSLIPFKKSLGFQKCYLVQDGATCHTSIMTIQYLKKSKIQIIQLPPWSPDLNPIVMIWNYMKQQFQKEILLKQFKTQDEIAKALLKIWDDINQTIINNTINKMKTNIQHINERQREYII